MRTIIAALVLMAPNTLMHAADTKSVDADFVQAIDNGRLANEGLRRCHRYLVAWMEHTDPRSGLHPRYVTRDNEYFWWPQDNAADNYPFMVLTAALTDRGLYHGAIRAILESETKLTSRVGAMPDIYDLRRQRFAKPDVDLEQVIFGSSEYIKDGLMPITEWLGRSPWSERLLAILDDMWRHAPIDTPSGKIVSTDMEVNGEMLQILPRMYWMTGERKYLDYAHRLADYYLLAENNPAKHTHRLKLRDHGCEIIAGLCEFYVTLHFAEPAEKEKYRQAMHEMLDRVLDIGRNEHGLFVDVVDPIAGVHVHGGATDSWGYTLNGYYAVFLVDNKPEYREAVLDALASLHKHYQDFDWEHNTSDGYADTIEGAINLYNREPTPLAARWIDQQITKMWKYQKPNGLIEGWYSDGNFARTTIMYALWKSQGLTIQPWRQDVVLGAVEQHDQLRIAVTATQPWEGRLVSDRPRHRILLKLPIDWPRINQFPEWHTVDGGALYLVSHDESDETDTVCGAKLIEGLPIKLKGREVFRLRVSRQHAH